MPTAILTDPSAILSEKTFAKAASVKVVAAAGSGGELMPQQEDFLQYFTQLERDHEHILVTVMSAGLAPLASSAARAVSRYDGNASISVIDSRHTGAGLGYLVELAEQAAAAGTPAPEIERLLRAAIPHIYTLLCLPDLRHVSASGFIHPAQAVVGEMLGLVPVYVLEGGQLSPLEKVRTSRHLIESLQEFMEEFDGPRRIAFSRGPASRMRSRPLRQFVEELFPATPFSEHILPPVMTHFFGESAIELAVLDKHALRPGR